MKTLAIISPTIVEYKFIRDLIDPSVGVKVFWAGYEYNEIVVSVTNSRPDLLLLSLNFATLDIPKLVRDIKCNIKSSIMVYIEDNKNVDSLIFDALNAGATDYFKVSINDPDSEQNRELQKKVTKILNIAQDPKKHIHVPNEIANTDSINLVIIGSSTGGPAALMDIIKKLPKMAQTSLVIIQHIEADYIQALVEWLSYHSVNMVELAQNHRKIEKGKIYLANGGEHLIADEQGYFKYTKDPEEYPYKPSINRFFESIAGYPIYYGTAVILTGMGRDGAIGMLKLKEKRWKTIAQDEQSSAVYGMPKAAKENGAAEIVLSLDDIADKIANLVI